MVESSATFSFGNQPYADSRRKKKVSWVPQLLGRCQIVSHEQRSRGEKLSRCHNSHPYKHRQSNATEGLVMRYIKINNYRVAVCSHCGLAPIHSAAAAGNNNTEPSCLPHSAKCGGTAGTQIGNPLYAVAYRSTDGRDSGIWGACRTLFAAPLSRESGVTRRPHLARANSGGKVVATRVQVSSQESERVPWLLIRRSRQRGGGSARDLHQRVNNTGGLAPPPPANPSARWHVPINYRVLLYRARKMFAAQSLLKLPKFVT